MAGLPSRAASSSKLVIWTATTQFPCTSVNVGFLTSLDSGSAGFARTGDHR